MHYYTCILYIWPLYNTSVYYAGDPFNNTPVYRTGGARINTPVYYTDDSGRKIMISVNLENVEKM